MSNIFVISVGDAIPNSTSVLHFAKKNSQN